MDRLTAQARQHAERHSERKAFNDQTAMIQALQRAREARQECIGQTKRSQPRPAYDGTPTQGEP